MGGAIHGTAKPSRSQNNYVSNGYLPPDSRVAELVQQAHRRFAPDLFGISMVDDRGHVTEAGDAMHEFTIMNVSKPFVFALVCDLIGPTGAHERIGANATGGAFNALAGIEAQPLGQTSPMVNAGAICTTSLAPGQTKAQRWRFLLEGLSRFAGRPLQVDQQVFASASGTNFRNRGIAWILQSMNRIYCDPVLAVELYTRQCARPCGDGGDACGWRLQPGHA